MTDIMITSETTLDSILYGMSRHCKNDEITQFILELDRQVDEYEFTSNLIDLLTKSIEKDKIAMSSEEFDESDNITEEEYYMRKQNENKTSV